MTTEVESTDLVVIKPAKTELESPEVILSAKISATLGTCMALKVTDELTSIAANDMLTRVRAFLKKIEEQRKSHLQPLNDYVKIINTRFATLRQPIETAESYLIKQITDYRRAIDEAAKKEQDRLQRLAERRVERAEAKGEAPPIPEAIAPIVPGSPKSVETDAGKVSFRTDWKAERIKGQEHLIPKEQFMTEAVFEVIDKQVNAIARSSKGTIQIPGYRIYSEEVPVTRMK